MKTILVLSGAGLSAESGIPTFRGSDGLWRTHRVEDVASLVAWKRDPALVLEFYAERFATAQRAQPNAAHTSLRDLETDHRVIHLTQNVDDLLERAGCTTIHHLHGRLNWARCPECYFRSEIRGPIIKGDCCPHCLDHTRGRQLRPDIVWFGEPVAIPAFPTPDYFIVVGTSLSVYPAASIVRQFPPRVPILVVDPDPPSGCGFTPFRGPATEQMPRVAAMIRGLSTLANLE